MLQGDSLLRLGEGGVSRLVARVVDARRHPVSGQPVAWRSSDPSVAVVDSAGRVTGVTAGRGTLAASGGDLVLELPVEVYPVPTTITLLAGDGQRAPAGQRLTVPLKAQIVSRGRPPDGRRPGAVHRGGADRTHHAGHRYLRRRRHRAGVSGPWATGRAASGARSRSTASRRSPRRSPRTPSRWPRTRASRRASRPSGEAGLELPEPVVVRVTDSTGAPLGDVPVSWEAAGGGTIVGDGGRTDSLGQARARWTLGPRAGSQRAYVQVGASRAVPRAVLLATALPGPAASLALVRGAAPRGIAARPLVPAVQVRVTDRHGNPVSGVRISLRPGQGTVAERTAVSDSTGRAEAAWTLGPVAGLQHLTASAQGIEAPLDVTARAMAGAPAKLALEGLPAAATVSRPLPQPVRVLVTDAHGNAAAGASVVFSTRSGALTPTRARTDSTGRAQTRWVLGTRAGDQVVEVVVKEGGLRASGSVRATVAPKRKAR